MTFIIHRSLKLALTILLVVAGLWLIAHLWASSTGLSLLGYMSEHGPSGVISEHAGKYSTVGILTSKTDFIHKSPRRGPTKASRRQNDTHQQGRTRLCDSAVTKQRSDRDDAGSRVFNIWHYLGPPHEISSGFTHENRPPRDRTTQGVESLLYRLVVPRISHSRADGKLVQQRDRRRGICPRITTAMERLQPHHRRPGVGRAVRHE